MLQTEKLTTINAVSPIDGRYAKETKELRKYFSEGALIGYRLFIEYKYLLDLLPFLGWDKTKKGLRSVEHIKCAEHLFRLHVEIDDNKDVLIHEEVALEVKEIEKITNHDVNAVIEWMRKKFQAYHNTEHLREMIHFGLTSMDINYPAQTLMLKQATEQVYVPLFKNVYQTLNTLSREFTDVPMMAYTHGQPASPTTMGKELAVFVERLADQFDQLKAVPYTTKFGGATGNMNAWYAAYPNKDWRTFADTFIQELGMTRTQVTTQIEPNDNLAAYCHNIIRINNILIDMCQDIWTYISREYFKQKIKKDEVGSSAMPHKVNPINFENAEGNLQMANALLTFFADKLTKSRLQRDLTDSTVMRNIGVPLGHTIIALNNIKKGLDKLLLNPDKINADLEANWIVVSEAYQTILRREGFSDAYDVIKKFVRTGKKIMKPDMHGLILDLNVPEAIKKELMAITPWNYIGRP